jgi:hypothetical protein
VLLGQQIDDLPFGLVPPLQTDNTSSWHFGTYREYAGAGSAPDQAAILPQTPQFRIFRRPGSRRAAACYPRVRRHFSASEGLSQAS